MGYSTANRFSRDHGVPRDFIRRLIAEGRCPGFYSGKAFRINEEMFLAQLEAECKRNAAGSEQSQ